MTYIKILELIGDKLSERFVIAGRSRRRFSRTEITNILELLHAARGLHTEFTRAKAVVFHRKRAKIHE
jgi:hypothetical protein